MFFFRLNVNLLGSSVHRKVTLHRPTQGQSEGQINNSVVKANYNVPTLYI